MSSFSKLLKAEIPAPKRSNFDLSHPSAITLSSGLLIPALVEEILPGDDIDLSIETRLKSHPTLAPILGAFDCMYYHFFCPLRNYVPEMNLNIKQVDFRDEFTLPYFPFGVTSPFENVRFVGAGSLLDYLGFPVGMSDISFVPERAGIDASWRKFNAVPLLAYWDIWRNYFANPQQEYANMDFGFGTVGIADTIIRYPVRFSVAELDEVFKFVQNSLPDFEGNVFQIFDNYGDALTNLPEGLFNQIRVENFKTELINRMNSVNSHAGLLPVTYHDDMFTARLNTSYVDYVKQQVRVDTTDGYFTIDSLRLSNKLAKFVDKTILGGTRYGQWLKSHFAVNGMEHLNIPLFLGMDKMSLYFDDVVAQADTNAGPNGTLGDVGGRASIHYPETNKVSFYAKEHGYLMTLVALRPRVLYYQGVPKHLQKTQFSEIYVPELDAVGWQPINGIDLCANPLANRDTTEDWPDIGDSVGYLDPDRVVGYSPAWIEYMTRVGNVHGQFATSLDYWVLLRRFQTLNDDETGLDLDLSTYVNSEEFNYPFAGTEDYYDNFYLNQHFNLYIKRNISKQILPTL